MGVMQVFSLNFNNILLDLFHTDLHYNTKYLMILG